MAVLCDAAMDDGQRQYTTNFTTETPLVYAIIILIHVDGFTPWLLLWCHANLIVVYYVVCSKAAHTFIWPTVRFMGVLKSI